MFIVNACDSAFNNLKNINNAFNVINVEGTFLWPSHQREL